MKQESKTPKKPLIFYYLIAMLVLLLLNALVFPSLLSPPGQGGFLRSVSFSGRTEGSQTGRH